MLKKLNNKKGFTLAELLVVVAIIGVLVAVSIPIFTAQLRKARVATDLANERSAKAAAVAAALTAEDKNTGLATSHTYYYDAASGTVATANSASIKAYGKVSDAKPDDGFADVVSANSTEDHTGKIVSVTVAAGDANGQNAVTIEWVAPSGS